MNMSVILATLQCNMTEEQALLDRPDVNQDAPTFIKWLMLKLCRWYSRKKIRIMRISVTMKMMRKVFKKSVHNCIQLITDSLEGLKQRHIFSVQGIITVHIVQECLSVLKQKYVRQRKLDKWFNQAKEQWARLCNWKSSYFPFSYPSWDPTYHHSRDSSCHLSQYFICSFSLQYFPAHKAHCDFFIGNFRKK